MKLVCNMVGEQWRDGIANHFVGGVHRHACFLKGIAVGECLEAGTFSGRQASLLLSILKFFSVCSTMGFRESSIFDVAMVL